MFWNLNEATPGIVLLLFLIGGIIELIDDHLEYMMKEENGNIK